MVMNIKEKKAIRQLAIELLDNENGISSNAYNLLHTLLLLTNNKDISDYVNITGDQVYMGEDDADELRRDISKWAEAQNDVYELRKDISKWEEAQKHRGRDGKVDI